MALVSFIMNAHYFMVLQSGFVHSDELKHIKNSDIQLQGTLLSTLQFL